MDIKPQKNRKKQLNNNIWKYYLIRVLSKRLVWPIFTIFLLRNDLTATEIGTISAVATFLSLIFEVPSGAIADKIGRKNSLVLAQVSWAVSMLLFWLGNSFSDFLIANSIYFIGGSFHTGTHDALIYETLKELKREKDFKRVNGKALFLSQVITGFLFIFVPFIADRFSIKLPFLLNLFVFIFSTLVVLTLKEPKREVSVSEKEIGNKKDFFGIKEFFSNKSLFLIAITFALISGINGLLEDFRQVYLKFINIDLTYFGFIYLALRFLTGFFGNNVEKIENKLGKEMTFWLMPITSLITYLGLFLVNSTYGLIFITLDGIQSGISRPIEQDYLNKAISDSKRVTFLSIFNLLGNLIRAIVVFFGGIIIDKFGINYGFLFLAILIIIFVFPSGFFMNKRINQIV